MKYILDFDRVLFDHDRLRTVMEEKELMHVYAEPGLWDYISPADFLYDDAIDFLQQYVKEDLYIVSAYTGRIGPNAEPYQERKLADSGIGQFVAEVIVMDGPKSPFVQRCAGDDRAIFVDDKRKYVEEVQIACPNVTCIQLLRPNAARTTFDEPADESILIPVVSDLSEVSAIIKKI